MIKLATTNIVGSASENSWSQAQSLVLENHKQVFVVLQLSCSDVGTMVDLATVGTEILSELLSCGKGAGGLNALEEEVKKIINGVGEGVQVGVMVGVLDEDNLLIFGLGSLEAYLSRGGKLASLGHGFESGLAVKGVLRPGDVVVLATRKFSQVVTLSKLKNIVTEDDNPAEMLAPLVHTQNETSGVAAIVGVSKKVNDSNKWPKIYLRFNATTPRKVNMWVGGALLVLLMVMIGVGVVRKVRIEEERGFTELQTRVNRVIDEVAQIAELNPSQARTMFTQARGEIEAYLLTEVRYEYKERARELLVAVEEADEKTFRKNDIQLTTVVELRVLAEGLQSEGMKSDGKGNLIFLDTNLPRIVGLNLVDRSRQIIELGEEVKLTDIAVNEATTYGLHGIGVNEYFWKKDQAKKAIEADEFWKEPLMLELFAGNVYILDREQGEIWKYPTLGDTFGGRRRWFATGIAPELTNVVDMKVVGDIWLLTSTGKLERYSRGAPVVFAMEGFPAKGEGKKLVDPKAMWVSESAIYVLEGGSERVVVFGNDGKFEAQYANSEFGKASDLVVVDGKGYVLIDNVVKEFGL